MPPLPPDKLRNQEAHISLGDLSQAFGWSPRFIEGLVRGEKLPAVEIDGQLRFHRDEVVDWLERKIHTLEGVDVSELEKRIEAGLLEDGTFRTHRSDRLASRLPMRGVALDVEIQSRAEVLQALVEIAWETGLLVDKEFLLASLIERENLCSTAMPGGVAICHPRRPTPAAIDRQFLCALRTKEPVDFGADNGEGTSLFFLLCATDDRSHLHGLARLARVLHLGGLEEFQKATDAEQFKDALSYLEARIDG
ncbi:MAG: system, fructose-specific component [Akkermansiaceae bacterium]|nr:system, fructose-specific component [Akkermansiaceae bacterium]